MKNKTKGFLFKLPSIIILLIVTIGSFYVKMTNMIINEAPIGWATPLTILIIFVLFILGEYYSIKADNNLF